jgi:hypothetical protein
MTSLQSPTTTTTTTTTTYKNKPKKNKTLFCYVLFNKQLMD